MLELPTNLTTDWLTPESWCCFLSLVASSLKNEVLDVFLDPGIDTNLGELSVKNHLVSKIPQPKDGEDNLMPARDLRTDTAIFAHELPPILFTDDLGHLALVTDNISISEQLWTTSRLLDFTVMEINKEEISAYTWFPYRPDQCHKPIPDLERISVCRNCSWDAILFPYKLPIDFGGCTVRYSSMHYPPNVYEDSDGNLRGREISLMNTIASSLGLSVIYKRYHRKNFAFYTNEHDGTIVGAVGELIHGDADFAFSSLVTESMYTRYAQALPSFAQSTVVWLLPIAREIDSSTALYEVFSPEIWILLVFTIFSAYVCIAMLAHFKRDQWLWLDSFAVLVATPITTKPKYSLTRVIVLLIQVFGFHMVWFYQSTLLRNIFAIPTEKQLTTLEEAVDSDLKAILKNYLNNMFNNTDHEIWNEILVPGHYEVVGDDTGYDSVVDYKSSFMMSVLTTDGYYMRRKYPGVPIPELVHIVKQPVANYPLTAYGRRGCPLTELYCKRMLHVIESGLFQFYTAREPDFLPIHSFETTAEDQKLVVGQLRGAFWILFTCYIICFTAFVAEHVWVRWGSKKFRPRMTKKVGFADNRVIVTESKGAMRIYREPNPALNFIKGKWVDDSNETRPVS